MEQEVASVSTHLRACSCVEVWTHSADHSLRLIPPDRSKHLLQLLPPNEDMPSHHWACTPMCAAVYASALPTDVGVTLYRVRVWWCMRSVSFVYASALSTDVGVTLSRVGWKTVLHDM